MSRKSASNPCIGLCSTVYGDLVCRGCKRFHHEIINWNRYSDTERSAVMTRLTLLLEQVVAGKLDVFDAALLRSQLEKRQIRFDPRQSPYCWAFSLICRGARTIRRPEAYGISLLPEFRALPLAEVRDIIDREYFLLSEAHYQRYIAPRFLVGGTDIRV